MSCVDGSFLSYPSSAASLFFSYPSSSSGATSTERSSSPSRRGVILMRTELSAVSATASSSSLAAVMGIGERRCIGEGGGTGEMEGRRCEGERNNKISIKKYV